MTRSMIATFRILAITAAVSTPPMCQAQSTPTPAGIAPVVTQLAAGTPSETVQSDRSNDAVPATKGARNSNYSWAGISNAAPVDISRVSWSGFTGGPSGSSGGLGYTLAAPMHLLY